MNHLQLLGALRNHYFIMRHGQSKANLQGIIISHPDSGTHEDYSLTELGQQQAQTSAVSSTLSGDTIIYSSDFSRARKTAAIVRQALGTAPVHLTPKLRERYFGNHEKADNANYRIVWKHDERSADHIEDNVESLNSVLDRTTSLVTELESVYKNKSILLVAHGDTLQILQTGFHKISPTKHRSLPHLEVAEIRELSLAATPEI